MTSEFAQPFASNEVAVYVPSTRFDKPIAPAEHDWFVEQVEARLSKLFGGATSVQATGSYLASNGQLIRETITVVSAFALEFDQGHRQGVIAIARWLGKQLNQEQVLVVLNGKAYFIER